MLVYVSFDGDGIGQMVGRARLADNVEEVRKVNQRIDRGNEIWKSFALSTGGSIIEIGGDEGALEIPADALDQLPAIVEQYAGAVEATVSVGVGMKLSEASKALLVAKLQGKNRILFYTEEMDEAIAEAQKHQGTEAEKLADEYLNKAEERWAYHSTSGDRLDSIRQRGLVPGAYPRHPDLEHHNHLFFAPDESVLSDYGDVHLRFPWPHDAQQHVNEYGRIIPHSFKSQTQVPSHQVQIKTPQGWVSLAPAPALNKAAPAMNPGPNAGFSGAARPDAPTVQKPVATQGDHEEGQNLYDLLADDRPAAPEATHAAADFERQLHEEAWKGHEEDMARGAQQASGVEQAKAQVVQALQALKAQGEAMEQVKQVAPQAYQAMMSMAQAVIGMAQTLTPAQSMAKAEPRITVKKHPKRADDTDIYRYVQSIHTGSGADLNKIPMDADFVLTDVPLKKLPALRPPDNAHVQQYSKLKTPFPPIVIGRHGSIPDGHHRIAAARLRGDQTIRAYVPAEELEAYVARRMKKSEFVEGDYPKRADDVEILQYFTRIHTGSRADLKKVPYDVEYELRELPVDGLTSGVPQDNVAVLQYSQRETPFPPIIMKSEGSQPLDGNHRVSAAKLRGDKTIRAYVPLQKAGHWGSTAPSGFIDPQGKLHELDEHEHSHWAAKHKGIDIHAGDWDENMEAASNAYSDLINKGWFSIGIAGGHNVHGQGRLIKDPNYPATKTLREIAQKYWGPTFDVMSHGISSYEGQTKHDTAIFARHGRLSAPNPFRKEELGKSKLPMPKAPTHHHVVLPSGSVVDNKVKVTHQDGHTSWKQVEAGQIRSQDPTGHPTSSRNPNSK